MASPLIIETKENRNTGIAAELTKRFNVPTLIEDIEIDYKWAALGVPWLGDSKTPSDLIASVNDGRLHSQVTSMKKAGGVGFIFIKGIFDNDQGWTDEQWDDLLISLQSEGILIVNARRDPARRLAYLYLWSDKENKGSWHDPVRLMPPAEGFFDEEFRNKVGMLMHLPGCGPDRAEKLLREFGLVGAVNAQKEDWQRVKGIGPKLADKWEAFLGRDR